MNPSQFLKTRIDRTNVSLSLSSGEQSRRKAAREDGGGPSYDPYVLPSDLPVPEDDGGCDHLSGLKIPSIKLHSIIGRYVDLAEVSQQPTVFFFYPHTGKPGELIGKTWDSIPGARGCTPQSFSFRDHYKEFKKLGFQVFGVSGQRIDEQIEFARRANLPYELLNDSDFELTATLRLPTFEFQSKRFIKRLALVVRKGRIERAFYPVFPPNKNAEEVLNYLRADRARNSPHRGRG